MIFGSHQLGSQWCYHGNPQLMVNFVIIFTQLQKIHSGSTNPYQTYQIEYPLYIPKIIIIFSCYYPLPMGPKKRNRVTGIQTTTSSIESAGYILIDYPYKHYKQSPSYPKKKQWGLLRTVYNVYIGIEIQYIQLVNAKKNYEIR